MAQMKHHDIQDEIQDGFELAQAPPVGADGAPLPLPPRRVLPPRPRLCEAGPCVNYHGFEIQTEAEDPRALKTSATLPRDATGVESVEGGSVYHPPRSFHTQKHHYCYPTVGVEMRLGSLPVISCNRWHPEVQQYQHELPEIKRDRSKFLKGPHGVRFQEEVAAWERARAEEQSEASEMDRLIAESLTNIGDVTP